MLRQKHNLLDDKPKSAPLTADIKLIKDEGQALDKHKYGYSQLIGSLMYLAVCTRPDTAQAVGALAKYMTAPTTIHWSAALGVVRYLANTKDYGICFGNASSSKQLLGYCDSDYAGDLDTRRSTTGYVFLGEVLGDSLEPTCPCPGVPRRVSHGTRGVCPGEGQHQLARRQRPTCARSRPAPQALAFHSPPGRCRPRRLI